MEVKAKIQQLFPLSAPKPPKDTSQNKSQDLSTPLDPKAVEAQSSYVFYQSASSSNNNRYTIQPQLKTYQPLGQQPLALRKYSNSEVQLNNNKHITPFK